MPQAIPRPRRAGTTLLPVIAALSAALALPLRITAADTAGDAEAAATADKPIEEGHSHHGEAFNEGPRQKAYLMGHCGEVSFPCTSRVEGVQEFVNQGVGQLHGFWYFEAERSFRQAAALDPDCAIAYWGMAMANANNKKRADEFVAEAVKRKDRAGDHERLYIDALNGYLTGKGERKQRAEKYIKALEQIALKYDDDVEAKAFLTLALYQFRRDVPSPSTLSIDALMRDVLAANPLHPVHHYRIHLWDHTKPERALDSAALCGASAPDIAHMWHMPGHIYSRLKRYDDAAWQQEASARVDHAHMIRDRLLPDQIHNFAHNNEWLCRNLVHVGRVGDAVALAKNMIELPRHPRYNHPNKSGCSTWYGRIRLLQALSEAEMWDELIALSATPHLEPTDIPKEQVNRLRHLGRAHFRRGDVEAGRRILAELERREADEKRKQAQAEKAAAEKVPAKDGQRDQKAVAKAQSDARRPFRSTLQAIARAMNELKGYGAVAAGDFRAGIDLLKKAGGVDPMYLATLRHLSGDDEAAEKEARAHVNRHPQETIPLANLIRLRWRMGRKDSAREAFEKLRPISGPVDLTAPVFARLALIAEQFGYPADWRIQSPRPKDFGERPDLESLGPFRWHPSPAETWALEDARGKSHSLSDFHGRPVVVIFYLGAGCLHCAQQLQAFGPKTEEFRRAGIELIAISTDGRDRLIQSHENYDGQFPFTLVSDAELDVFKAYRCYDDFEDLALHGTFLIDADGLVRWHDISYEPFMEPDFVLSEARRLLAPAPREPTVVTARKPLAPAIAE